LTADQGEVILAQEQGAVMHPGGASRDLEAEFGFGSKEGTLVLTNRRLIFVCTNDRGEELPVGWLGEHLLLYTEVEGLDEIPDRPPNVFLPLEALKAKGHREEIERPSLEVAWDEGGRHHTLVFTETMLGRRKRNLNDWAKAIDGIRDGTLKLISLPPVPPTDSLDGKVMHVMADMQEKGVLEIEESVEGEYKLDLDPDQVQGSCDGLASRGLLIRIPDSSGDTYYRRASPLGEDDLSN
jgi:hypothetical protein